MITIFNPVDVFDKIEHRLGTLAYSTPRAAVFVFVRASLDITQYDVCSFSDTFTANPVLTSSAREGHALGVAVSDIPLGHYGWLLIHGNADFRVATGTAANVALTTGNTPGTLGQGASPDVLTSIYAQSVDGYHRNRCHSLRRTYSIRRIRWTRTRTYVSATSRLAERHSC